MKNIIIQFTILFSFVFIFFSCAEKKPSSEEQTTKAAGQTAADVKKADQPDNNAGEPGTYRISKVRFNKAGMEIKTLANDGGGDYKETITAAGYLMVPKDSRAEVSAYIGGYIQSSDFLPGDYVTKGQFLVKLENLEYVRLQQDYLKAVEKLKYLKTVYERQEILAGEKIASENSRQQAQSEYKSARADVEGLQKMLTMININPAQIRPENISPSIELYAPISGYITKVNAVKGKFADPAEIIFEIINTNDMFVELKVYEKDILKIRKGQKISFVVPEATSAKYEGKVFLVGKTINESDRTITVYCQISGKSKVPVVVGMYVEAEIYTNTEQNFCLPLSAVISEDAQSYVFVNTSTDETDLVFSKIKVETKRTGSDCIEILGAGRNLLRGKPILVKGAAHLVK